MGGDVTPGGKIKDEWQRVAWPHGDPRAAPPVCHWAKDVGQVACSCCTLPLAPCANGLDTSEPEGKGNLGGVLELPPCQPTQAQSEADE